MTEKQEKNSLLDLLNSRLELARNYTKQEFIDDAKKSIDDYNFSKNQDSFIAIDTDKLSLVAQRRYNQTLPLIFSYTETLKAQVFDRFLEVVIKQRGKKDEQKALMIKATYEYLKDKLYLEEFQMKAFDIFSLLGFISAHTSFKSEYYEEPYINEETGEPELDEMGNPIMIPVYTYNDPIVRLNKYDKVYFSPESEYDNATNENIPYYIIENALTKDEVEDTFGKKVEPDIEVEIDKDLSKKACESDIKKVGVFYYYGQIPSEFKDKVKGWSWKNKYYCVFTKKKMLLKPQNIDETHCAFGRFVGLPDKFFGFGFGKIGRYFQQEKSIRRGQQTRLADLAAYPKWLIKDDGENLVDTRALADPRALPFLTYKTEPPQLSNTPNLADVVSASENSANIDVQQAFGVMDLVTGAQDGSGTDTATGQSIFAEASNKRIAVTKKKFAKFYLQVVTNLFKLCAENWDESKIVTITDGDGQEMDVELTKEALSDIDFDNDLVIDTESQVANKDIQKAQNIELYDRMKDDPLINRKEIVKKLLRENYDITNSEAFFTSPTLPAGTQLTDAEGNVYTTDETGQLVQQEAQDTLAESGEGGESVPSDPASLMGASQNATI